MVTEIGETNCALVSAVPPRERKIDCETPSVDDASQQREPVELSSAQRAWSFARLFGVNWGTPYSCMYVWMGVCVWF